MAKKSYLLVILMLICVFLPGPKAFAASQCEFIFTPKFPAVIEPASLSASFLTQFKKVLGLTGPAHKTMDGKFDHLLSFGNEPVRQVENSIITHAKNNGYVEALIFYALDASGNVMISSPVITSNTKYEISGQNVSDGFNLFIHKLATDKNLPTPSDIHSIVAVHTHPKNITVGDMVAAGRWDALNYSSNVNAVLPIDTKVFSKGDLRTAANIREGMNDGWRSLRLTHASLLPAYRRLSEIPLEFSIIVPHDSGPEKLAFILSPSDTRLIQARNNREF